MNKDDLVPLLDEIGRFSRDRIGVAAARPESPIDTPTFERLTREAVELGLVPSCSEAEGFGLWTQTDHAEAVAFSIGALRHLGRDSPAVALAWHRCALARNLAKQIGFVLPDAPLATALTLVGHYGLARTSLARWLKGASLGNDDQEMLGDWLDRQQHATPMLTAAGWTSLIWPEWHDQRIAWRMLPAHTLSGAQCRPQHGLDELSGWLVQGGSGGELRIPAEAESRRLYGHLLKADCIGLLAIALGALDNGQQLARDYAALRRQGGKRIDQHAAVQTMLGEVAMALQQAQTALHGLAQPLDDLDAGRVLALRASLHDGLCQAANQVMQIHGGIGYMRDCGVEKIVRAQNMLKLQSGGTREIALFLAAWGDD